MRPLILCRQRLRRILAILDREGGELTIRRFLRSYAVYPWEIEQAAELGWLEIEARKPRTGRPSIVAKKLSKTLAAKVPPWRHELPHEISIRHWNFVFAYLTCWPPCNARKAYLATFPKARSKAGADASAHRLLKHPDVKAALAWTRARVDSDFPASEKSQRPRSAADIREIFSRVSYWRRWQL